MNSSQLIARTLIPRLKPGLAKPIGHLDSPVMTVFGKGDTFPRLGPVMNWKTATYGLLSEQQGTSQRTGAHWLK